MRRIKSLSLVVLGALGLNGPVVAGEPPQPPLQSAPCRADDPTVICGDAAAEDLVAIPGTRWVLASAYAGAGGLRLIDRETRHTITLPFRPAIDEAFDRKAFPSCPGPLPAQEHARLLTHGLGLAGGRGGKHLVYAVHHGSRESVEAFRIDTTRPVPSLTWIGCVVAPGAVGLNAVAALPQGGLVATNFASRAEDWHAAFAKMSAGQNTGEVWTWYPAQGWTKVVGSEGSGLNGIEASPDGKTIYVASWGGQSLVRLARDGSGRTTVPLGFRVDNVHWRGDGQLIAAGQIDGGSKVVAIDPAKLTVISLVEQANSLLFANASVGLQVGRAIWLGSYGSPNIAIVTPHAAAEDTDEKAR